MTSLNEIPAREITILLVEDDPRALWRLQDALVKAGFVAAARAARAIAPLTKWEFPVMGRSPV